VRARALASGMALVLLVTGGASGASNTDWAKGRFAQRGEVSVPEGYEPAVARSRTGRYFVVMRAPSASQRYVASRRAGAPMSARAQRDAGSTALASQQNAVNAVESRGGSVFYRYSRLVNAFSARMSVGTAAQIARRSDVVSVQPVGIARATLESSVPLIGAPKVWKKHKAKGRGVTVAVVDTGVDYTHAAFGGPGTAAAYNSNDPTIVEAGTFPTNKVIAGTDLVGEDYDVLDTDPANDVPVPDPDPLDEAGNDHGTHVAGTCCGKGVPGEIGRGVAPRTKIVAIKVWDEGNSTADVLVAGFERAVDPNDDGAMTDKVDVLSFSGGVDFGTAFSLEAVAAQQVVDLGTVFVAAAGNAGNQPVGGQPYITGTPATAPGAISVASSIDQFVAATLDVNSPAAETLPENGITAWQDWSAPLQGNLTGDVFDARAVVPPSDPTGAPSPEDAQLCGSTPPGQPFAGQIALVFKGPTDAGDCTATEKVFRAQEAGAIGVILWSGFPGLPFLFAAGDFADQITIPAVLVSSADGEALGELLSPTAPAAYNTADVNVTVNASPEVIAGIKDWISDFSSEGPARVTNALKPDITAPGSDIKSALAGSGDGALTISGTSMATPHVSGSSALLLDVHPKWTPAQVKAALMNQAKRNVGDPFGAKPVSATIMGAGRVRVNQSADAKSLAVPGSLSFGLQHLTGVATLPAQTFTVQNKDRRMHEYRVTGGVRYSDFDPAIVDVDVSLDGTNFLDEVGFLLKRGAQRTVHVRLTLDPSVISPPEQLYGWYFFHPNVDGSVVVNQSLGSKDKLLVPWHVAPLAASQTSVSDQLLDLTSGTDTFSIVTGAGAGVDQADVYQLGALDGADGSGEADITHVGVRSFTGDSVNDDVATGLPPDTDALGGLPWIEFMSSEPPTEPIEFGVRLAGTHNTTSTMEINVLIDVGADGNFADDQLGADFMLSKLPGGGETCLFDLSAADPFADCLTPGFSDYSNFNTNVFGLMTDAGALGVSNGQPEISYQVVACTGVFSGDVPEQICDTAIDLDAQTGTYAAVVDVTDEPLIVSNLICGGFWGAPTCGASEPVTVDVGSAVAGSTPSLLVLFPNNPPPATAEVITTTGI
jgi:subtilisin family serine protease